MRDPAVVGNHKAKVHQSLRVHLAPPRPSRSSAAACRGESTCSGTMVRYRDRPRKRAGSLKKAGTWDLSPSLHLGDCGSGTLLPSALFKSNWHLLSLPRCHSCSRLYPGPPSVSLNTAPFSPPHEIYRAPREANPPQTRIPNHVLMSQCRQDVSTGTHSQL